MAGVRREVTASAPGDFDVEAAFDPDFDFDALFASDDLDDEGTAPKARVHRSRVALALSITLAALPLLFLDNFQANASTPGKGDASARHEVLDPTGPPALDVSLGPVGVQVQVTPGTMAPAVVFNAELAPTTTTTEAPTTSSTAALKRAYAATTTSTTSTTVKPKIVTFVAPSTTSTTSTTKPPAPTTTTTKPPAAPTVAAAIRPGDPNAVASWDALAKCEANGNWAANTGNGYYGGLQFSLATWQNLGGSGYPHQASKATQIAMGKKLYDRSGWKAWPGCARKLGWL